jgi:ferrochelatase
MPAEKTAVLLMNLGGPRSLAEVEPFLYELFSDPDVISAPLGPLRKVLARFISRRRAPSSSEKYQLIGGASPLVPGTQAQARSLEQMLGPGFSVHLAMRYGHPNSAEGVREALDAGAKRAVALPLYPQFANATTGSSLAELKRHWPAELPLLEVLRYAAHPAYLAAAAACLREALAQVPSGAEPPLVIYSAHGLPMSQVRRGDPYPQEIEATARETSALCGVAEHQVTYQSRVGPARWLGPDTLDFLRERARGRTVVAVPVSFVSEHLETLYDLDILAAQEARAAGCTTFIRAPAPGARPEFIAALAAVVRERLGDGGQRQKSLSS